MRGLIVRILILAPHADDGEVGAGAAIHRWVQEGHEIHYLAFSLADGGNREEISKALDLMGVRESLLLPFEVRRLADARQAILNHLIQVNVDFNPDMVLLPSTDDVHQDHQVISSEGFRAFKRSTVLGYELPWNDRAFSTDLFVVVSEEDVRAKWKALLQYKSQTDRHLVEHVWDLARIRGRQILVPLAEAFEVLRWIMK